MANEIGLLEPRVMNGVVRDFAGLESMLGRNIVGAPVDEMNPTWEYDIVRVNRSAADTFNVPNGPARVVDHDKIAKMTGSFAYLRDKKVFNATTLRWLRAAGDNEVARRNAEMRVMQELESLRMQHLRAEEKAIWFMLGGNYSSFANAGQWSYNLQNGASITVDYHLHDDNKINPSTPWLHVGNPIGDISAAKRAIERGSGIPASRGYMNSQTMETFIRTNEVAGRTRPQSNSANNTASYSGLSDRMLDMLKTTGMMPKFLGIDWYEYDGGYVDEDGTFQPYIRDNTIVMLTENITSPWNMLYGPSADTKAPAGHTGPFVKTWDDEDPSGKQLLMEHNFMPVLYKPRHVVTLFIG